jgi:serine protease Do
MAKYIYNQLLEEGEVMRGYLGITIQNLTSELAESFGLEDFKGVLIPNVSEGSAADEGGIKKGDIIIELNGEPIEKAEELRNKVAMLKPGTKVKVVLLRDDIRKILTVRLGKRPPQEQLGQQMEGESEAGEQLGITVQNLTDNLAERLGYEDISGVVISGVKPGSLAAMAGLKTGMLITEVDRKQIHNIKDFNEALSRAREKGAALLLVNTSQFNRYVVLKFQED